jgi:serine protease Do
MGNLAGVLLLHSLIGRGESAAHFPGGSYMNSDTQKFFSLAAVVVAAILFGMVLAGAINVTPPVDADPPAPVQEKASQSFRAPDFVSLADLVVPSVVSVFSKDVEEPSERRRMPSDPFHFFFGPRDEGEEQRPRVQESSGSGFFISASGELLTNNHVIEDADQIRVRLADGETEYRVEVVGTDPATDIALLKVIKPNGDVPFLQLGDSAGVRVGEWVMAVGNPLNMEHTVTVGVVSAKGRALGLSPESTSFENFIQTDAAINFGNSGGPLVNLAGQVIGINTAINARGQNLGFAIPVDTARRILPQLRERGRVVRGYLGVSIESLDRGKAEAFGLDSTDGALVREVVAGHAAEKAGVRHGDVIVTVDGESVKDTRDLIDTISAMPPDTKVELGLIREGEAITVTVTLEERELEGEQGEPVDGPSDEGDVFERVGITVSELTPRIRQGYRLDDDVEGVVVTRVRPISPAGDEGMQQGDVIIEANTEAITSLSELGEAIEDVEAGGYLRLYVFNPRFGGNRFVILQLEE